MVRFVIGAGLGIVGTGFLLAFRHVAGEARKVLEGNGASTYEIREARETAGNAKLACAGSALVAAVGAALIATSCFYSQDVGDTVVLRNLGGSIAGQTTEAGFHAKLPWQDVVTYDVRNNLVNFYGDGDYAYDGGSVTGPCVRMNDSSGASADVDIQVNYSLDPDSATYLYSEYGSQETFAKNYVANDLRSVAREVAGQFDTLTMLTDRAKFTSAVQERLSEKWRPVGLAVEQVSVQDVRYPDEISQKYAEAQAAEVARQQAQNEQETAKVKAETKKIEAQGEADANAVLTQSLTPEVLSQRYIDALKEIGASGNLVVVPEGSTPMVSAK